MITLILSERRLLAAGTVQLVFTGAGGELLPYRPGQFVRLHFEHRGQAWQRSYSIASRCADPSHCRRLVFALSYVAGGPASERLFDAPPGLQLGMTGPYGKLLLPEQLPPRLILCATGTGVAPYRAMAPQLVQALQSDPALTVALLFGCRRAGDALWANEWRSLAQRCPGFHYRCCLSRETPSEPQHCAGHLQSQLQLLAPEPGRDRVYLCGNPSMIDECFALLKLRGFDHRSVRREKFLLAGR